SVACHPIPDYLTCGKSHLQQSRGPLMIIPRKRGWFALVVMSFAFAMTSEQAAGQNAWHFRYLPPGAGIHRFPLYNYYYANPYPIYPLYASYPMYYSPYSYGYAVPDPYGGYLKGAADVINSQGQYLKSTQEAYLLNEQLKAAQLQN